MLTWSYKYPQFPTLLPGQYLISAAQVFFSFCPSPLCNVSTHTPSIHNYSLSFIESIFIFVSLFFLPIICGFCLSVCLSVCLSACLSLCLSVSTSLLYLPQFSLPHFFHFMPEMPVVPRAVAPGLGEAVAVIQCWLWAQRTRGMPLIH